MTFIIKIKIIKSFLNKHFQNVTTNNPDKEQLYLKFSLLWTSI